MHAGARAPRLSFRTRHDRPPFYLVDVPYCFPQVLERFGDDLPYLFKVLSVDTALSIQAHPDKSLAEQLHAERPHVYKDDNHKPEMAVALHDFSGTLPFLWISIACLRPLDWWPSFNLTQ